MKLLRVIRSTDPASGGPIEGLTRTSEILIRAGHKVDVLSLEPESFAARYPLPFPVYRLGGGVGRYGFNPRLVSWLRQNARQYDAVVVHGLWNYSSLGSWLGLRNSHVPYYVYTHGMLDPWFRDANPKKHAVKQIFWLLGEGRVLRDARAVFFTSDEERLRARGVFKGFSYTERTVLYGTADPKGKPEQDRASFYEAFPHLKGRRFLVFMGRIHPKKGCDLLIRAFAESLAAIPEDLDLVMAGPDQVGWTSELKSMVANLGVGTRVHWTEMLKDKAKWGAFRSAEALILPSHQENFGIVVAEAMACHTPVLISDKVNIWREVERSGGGLVEPDTLDGTRKLLVRYFSLTQEQRADMREAARKSFLQSFEIEAAGYDLMRQLGFPQDGSVRESSGIAS